MTGDAHRYESAVPHPPLREAQGVPEHTIVEHVSPEGVEVAGSGRNGRYCERVSRAAVLDEPEPGLPIDCSRIKRERWSLIKHRFGNDLSAALRIASTSLNDIRVGGGKRGGC